MKKNKRLLLIVLLLLSVILVACGGGEEADVDVTVQIPQATEAPEEVEPEATSTTAPTDTPEPTATTEPTDTPEPEPTATADPSEDFELFEDNEGGVAIRYPADWFVQGSFGFNTLASAEELLDSPDPGEEGGVVLLLAASSDEIGANDPVEAINRAADEFDLGEDTEFVEGPTAVDINGLDGAKATLYTTSDDGTPLSAIFVIAFEGDRAALFIGVTPRETEADFFPIFETMINTIALIEPTVVDTPLTNLGIPESQGFLLYGDTVEGTIGTDEVVVWDFIGIEGEVFDLTVEPAGDLDVVVDILDAEGNSILASEVDNSFGIETLLAVDVPSTGDFHVTVKGFDGSAGDYSLTISEAGSSTSTGGDLASAGSLNYGDRIQSTVPVGDAAKWSFTALTGDVVNIVVTPLDEDLDVVVDVLDASGNSILESGEVDASFDAESIADLLIAAGGNFIISVRGFADSTGSFELSLDSSSGGAAPTGDMLVYGDTTQGTIVGTETVTFSFLGQTNDLVDVTVSSIDEDLDLVLDFLDSNGRSILEDGEIDSYTDKESIRVYRLPQSGAYTIAVHGFEGTTGNFTLDINESNDGVSATVLYSYYSIELTDEAHAFPFNALAGDQVMAIVTSTDTDLDVVLELYNDDTDELIETVDDGFDLEEFKFEVPEDGNYYFYVKSFEETLGDYDIILLGPATTQFVLAANDVIDGQFTEDESVIQYWFDGLAGETIDLTLEGDDEIDVVIRILDEDGNMLTEMDAGLYGDTEELSYTFAEDTTILIEVSDFFSDGGFFNFYIESDQ